MSYRWHDFNNNENGISLKVRISLPPKTPTRIGPKRTAAERKVVDETLSDDEGSDYKKSASKPKRGRSKKTEKSKLEKNQEYEVLKIIDDKLENGKKLYRIRWKGWSSSDDTWEPKASLSCPEIIKAYESNKKDDTEYEVHEKQIVNCQKCSMYIVQHKIRIFFI